MEEAFCSAVKEHHCIRFPKKPILNVTSENTSHRECLPSKCMDFVGQKRVYWLCIPDFLMAVGSPAVFPWVVNSFTMRDFPD